MLVLMAFDEVDTVSLIRRHRGGEQAALEELFRRHVPRVERIVRVRMGPLLAKRVDVADVVQETLLRGFEKLDSFEPREEARLVHWLATIAEHKIQELARLHGRAKRDVRREVRLHDVARASGASSVTWDPATDATGIVEKLQRRELAQTVDACLAELPAEWREAILLRDYADASWGFVAEQLGKTSEGAARALYHRARAELAERVRRRMRRDADSTG